MYLISCRDASRIKIESSSRYKTGVARLRNPERVPLPNPRITILVDACPNWPNASTFAGSKCWGGWGRQFI